MATPQRFVSITRTFFQNEYTWIVILLAFGCQFKPGSCNPVSVSFAIGSCWLNLMVCSGSQASTYRIGFAPWHGPIPALCAAGSSQLVRSTLHFAKYSRFTNWFPAQLHIETSVHKPFTLPAPRQRTRRAQARRQAPAAGQRETNPLRFHCASVAIPRLGFLFIPFSQLETK